MDDIPIVQPVVVPPQINQPPEENNSPFHAVFEQLKKWFGGVLDYGSWFLLFFFAPFTVAIIISQNSIPGEFFYPVKLGLEKIVLNGASLHPTTRAMFHANISGRRFDEAERLLLTRSDTTGLETFISQIETTQLAVNSVSDPVEKQRLEGELLVKINEYQAKLVEVKVKAQEQGIFVAVNPQTLAQISASNAAPPASTLAPTVTTAPIPTLAPSPTPTVFVVKPTSVIATNTKLTPAPTAPPVPSATPTIPLPTHTPIPVTPPPVQAPTNQVDTDIDHTQEKLERIKKEIEEKQKEEQRERLEKLEKKEKEQEDRKEKEKKSSDADKKEKDAN